MVLISPSALARLTTLPGRLCERWYRRWGLLWLLAEILAAQNLSLDLNGPGASLRQRKLANGTQPDVAPLPISLGSQYP